MTISELKIGDKIETKKNHPCGGNLWEIIRTGADFKLRCCQCGRVVMLTPDELKKRIRRVLEGQS